MEHSFQSLGLNETLTNIVDKLYFKNPTDIQREAIPKILQGEGIVGESQTGSGKTHAFLLPLLQNIEVEKEEVQVVITAPTRELATQLHEELKTMVELADKKDEWTSRLLIGGLDRKRMIKQLERPPKIIVGTPGRILDMISEGILSIYSAKSFVIDEADLMLDLRFIETIDELLVNSREDVQIIIFSATIPIALQHFIRKYLRKPTHIKIKSSVAPETMTHRLIDRKHQDIGKKIRDIAAIIQPYVAILFVNSKESADEIYGQLRSGGLNVGVLHGGLTSRERMRTVKDILQLKYEYIVATDLASRGIDIKGASHVINIELPKEVEFYIHRVGRTARAGMEGTAISFYKEEDIPLIEKLEKQGIRFIYSDIKQGEFIEAKRYNQRSMRKKTNTDIDKEAWKQVRKPKKVKPGYKKKMKEEHEKIKKKLQKKDSRTRR